MKNRFKDYFLACSTLLFCYLSHAQDIIWEKSFGGRHAEYLADLQPTADYGFILGGSSLSNKSGNKAQESTGDLDYLIWKMDEHGSTDWQKSFGGSGSDLLKVINATADGGFILSGISNSPEGFDKKDGCRGGNDFWLLKLDAKGEEMWQRVFGGLGEDNLAAVISTKDGGYLIGGSSSSSFEESKAYVGGKKENSRGSLDYWIIKIDADGNELWQRTYGGKYADVLQSLVATSDGGYLIGGYSNSPSSKDKSTASMGVGNDFWILKLDAAGKIEWQKSLGGAGEDQLKVLYESKDGNYIAAGSSNSVTRTSKSGTDLWVVKMDIDGFLIWEKAYDIAENDILTSLIEVEDGSFLIGACSPSSYTQSNEKEGINDYVALKVAVDGTELWRKVYGSNGEDVLKKLIETRDGGYLLVGTSNPEFNGYTPKRSNQKLSGALQSLDNSQQLEGVKKLQEEMDAEVNQYATEVNNFVKEQGTALTEGLNSKLDKYNNSRFKVGANGPVGDFLNPSKGGASQDGKANLERLGPKPGSKTSRDKKVNYGGKDYWILKLKDKERKLKEKTTIEAYPNPTTTYANVIIGFGFDSGTASVYDLAGKQLQRFKIEHQTVPVNLSDYPLGIYIINIKTNKGEGSVKIIKGK
jgi:hypothetical protein